MNRPIDIDILRNLLFANGMRKPQWEEIEKYIDRTRQIHHSIIFFILDPYIAVKLLPQRWYDLFPVGFIDFINNISKDIDDKEKIAFFRRALHFDVGDGLYKIIDEKIHIDKFLTHIPDCFLDILLGDKTVLNKLIDRCKELKQEDSIGYTKLLLLK